MTAEKNLRFLKSYFKKFQKSSLVSYSTCFPEMFCFRKFLTPPLSKIQQKRFVANKFAISSPVTTESISFRELLLLCEAL